MSFLLMPAKVAIDPCFGITLCPTATALLHPKSEVLMLPHVQGKTEIAFQSWQTPGWSTGGVGGGGAECWAGRFAPCRRADLQLQSPCAI